MKRFMISAATALALGASPAVAHVWDTNDDGSIDAEEFVKGNLSAATFERFDDNGDDAISFEEVGLDSPDAVFRAGDDNGDGVLTREELSVATFYSYDVNDNDVLEAEEIELFERDERIRSMPFGGPGPNHQK